MGIYYNIRESLFQKASESEMPLIKQGLAGFFHDKKKRKIIFLTLHKYSACIVVVLFIVMFHMATTRSSPPSTRFSLQAILSQGTLSTAQLMGLILSTLRVGGQFRWVTALLLLPSFGFSIIALGYYNYFVGIVSLLVIIWSYWIVLMKERVV